MAAPSILRLMQLGEKSIARIGVTPLLTVVAYTSYVRRGERQRQTIAANLAQRDLHDVRERVALEDIGDGISHVDHQHSQPAVLLVRAGAALVAGLARACDWREATIDQAYHFSDGDLIEP